MLRFAKIGVLSVVSFLGYSTASLAQERVVYLWADRPHAETYSPSATYLSRLGDEVRIDRVGTGRYTVTFDTEIETDGVQVSTYGTSPAACQITAIGANEARIGCFTIQGEPRDASFTFLAASVDDDVIFAARGGLDPAGVQGDVRRLGPGSYTVAHASLQTGANVQITPIHESVRACRVQNWGSGSAKVLCTDATGAAADSGFSALVVKALPQDQVFSFAWADRPQAASYAASTAYAHRSDGEEVRVERSAIGRYRVDLGAVIGQPGGNVQVTDYGAGTGRCQPVRWQARIAEIACYDAEGRPTDSRFTVLGARAEPAADRQDLPDLVAELDGVPAVIAPGGVLDAAASVAVANFGRAPAPGSLPGAIGYMVDLVLSSDLDAPAGYAPFDPSFGEDVLLQGGRVSNTSDLQPGDRMVFGIADDRIPADTPPGDYHLCARVDPGGVVEEADETNNLTCASLRVAAAGLDAERAAALDAAADTMASAIRLSLDQSFYDPGETITARVEFGDMVPPAEALAVHIVAPSGDVEALRLEPAGGGRFETVTSHAVLDVNGDAVPHDKALRVAAGDRLEAILFVEPDWGIDIPLVAASAFVATEEAAADIRVVDEWATEAEDAAAAQGFPFGRIMAEGGLPVAIATGQVILAPVGLFDLPRFLSESGGSVISELPPDETDPGALPLYLVHLPLEQASDDQLALLRRHFGEQGMLFASSQETLQTTALIMEFRMRGYAVSANVRVEPTGPFETVEMRSGVLRPAMTLADTRNAACAAADPSCPLNVQALWAHMALWDFDTREVPVAFFDQGFATASPDFRRPASGAPWVECDYASLTARPLCAPGVANAPPTVGASLVGPRVWHGTGSVATAGGVLDNAWTPGLAADVGGSAGPGGQVLVPMMYRMDLASYAFQMGDAMRRATDAGAACINIAAGYPCNIGLTVIGDFALCDAEERGRLCDALAAATTLAAHTAAAAVCAPNPASAFLDLITGGVFSPVACASATAAATSASVSIHTTCIALRALGTRGPMSMGVAYASRRGVPIIASMGNQFTAAMVPEGLRPFIAPSTFAMDGDALQIIPATIAPVIAIGAANAALGAPWRNTHIRGATVVVWAPEDSTYLAPAIGAPVPTGPAGFTVRRDHGGTSSASSFVTGVIAAMQAADPTLNPNTPGLTTAQRLAIPGRISGLLAATATEMGTGTAEPARLPMVNPLAALRAVADPTPAGFDRRLNFGDGLDDQESGATRLFVSRPGTRWTGTIIARVGTAGAPTRRDVDHYSIASPATGIVAGRSIVSLAFPIRAGGRPAGELRLVGVGWRALSTSDGPAFGTTVIRTIRYISPAIAVGRETKFRIEGVGNDDNVYTLSLEAGPRVIIDVPTAGAEFFANELITLQGRAFSPGLGYAEIDGRDMRWSLVPSGEELGIGKTIRLPRGRLGVGPNRIRLTARSGDLDGAAEVQISVSPPSTDAPPTARILAPASGYEAYADRLGGGWGIELSLRGSGSDPELGALGDAALTWYAIGPDGVRQRLGQGRHLRAVFLSDGNFSTTYRIELEVSDGTNVSTDAVIMTLLLLS